MHHAFIDKYADLDSPVHRLDPRAKILGALASVLTVVLLPFGAPWEETAPRFVACLIALLALIVASRVPVTYLLARCLVVIPFVLMLVIFIPFVGGENVIFRPLPGLAVTEEGLVRCGEILCKAMTSVLMVLVLTSTTRFSQLLQGLRGLKFPKTLILILSFLYRYLFVLQDEIHRIRRAVASRGGRGTLRVLASVLGVLFLRTYERAERVYAAMLARGFGGEIRAMSRLRWTIRDSAFIGITFALLEGIWLTGRVL
ncbi:MAG: cobalt ECF transporter T component CbiQ [Planctomycetota bacterium]|nr:cobalt ECF transporter T component CbiQ [Planctomycetota bacterium]